MAGLEVAVALGLDPRGYPSDGGFIPWDTPADEVLECEYDEDEEDEDEEDDDTLLDRLTDIAGAQGLGLVEYLGLHQIGPESDDEDDDDEDDY